MAGPAGRLARRLAALEAAAPPPAPCSVCWDWPPVAYVHDWRAPAVATWPPALRCPACGRAPTTLVEYTDRWPPGVS